jgi:hypothetical protein|tara:strand:+ start:3261 stop:3695 length:435 start_codon:yes stop_codon:yes gene_type:complete
MKQKQAGYDYEEFKSQPYRERSLLEALYNYTAYGVSPSELKGAHSDIDKLIENADPKAKIAEVATISMNRDLERLFRVLNPDSTVKMISVLGDRFLDDEQFGSLDAGLRARAIRSMNERPEYKGMDKNLAAFLLAAARNNPYQP